MLQTWIAFHKTVYKCWFGGKRDTQPLAASQSVSQPRHITSPYGYGESRSRMADGETMGLSIDDDYDDDTLPTSHSGLSFLYVAVVQTESVCKHICTVFIEQQSANIAQTTSI